jgi:hypothetical protein
LLRPSKIVTINSLSLSGNTCIRRLGLANEIREHGLKVSGQGDVVADDERAFLERFAVVLIVQLPGNLPDDVPDKFVRHEKDQEAEIFLEILMDDGDAFFLKNSV